MRSRRGGGECVEGRCQPQTIAASVDTPLSVAVNSSGVFWITPGTAEKCPKTGCLGSPTVLASSSTQLDVLARRHLFVNEANVYWLGDSPAPQTDVYIYECAVAGCGMTPRLIGDYTGAGQLVGNSKSLIWYDATGSLKVVPLSGGAHTDLNLVRKSESFGFAVDEQWLVFSATDTGAVGARGVWIGKIENKVPTRLMDKGLHVAISAGQVVLASVNLSDTESTVVACAVTGCGGSGAPLFSGAEGKINDIVADATAVYWAVAASPGAADGKIRGCALPNCPGGPKTLAEGQANPYALALDADFVYWANKGVGGANSGSIVRVRRP